MPTPDELAQILAETPGGTPVATAPPALTPGVHPAQRASVLQGLLDEQDAATQQRANRGFFGDVAAGFDAAQHGLARGIASFPQGLARAGGQLLGVDTDAAGATDPNAGFFSPITSKDTRAALSTETREAQANLGDSKVANITDQGLGIGMAMVPGVGQGLYALDAYGNRRQDSIEAGLSDNAATGLGLLEGGLSVVAPKVAGAVVRPLAGAAGRMAGNIARVVAGNVEEATAAKLGGAAAGAAEHAIESGAGGAALGVGSGVTSLAAGDTDRAAQEFSPANLAKQAAIGGALGVGTGAVTGYHGTAEAIRTQVEAQRQRDMADVALQTMQPDAGAPNVAPAPTSPIDAASAVTGDLPRMAGEPAPRFGSTASGENDARLREMGVDPEQALPAFATHADATYPAGGVPQTAEEVAGRMVGDQALEQAPSVAAPTLDHLAAEEQGRQTRSLQLQQIIAESGGAAHAEAEEAALRPADESTPPAAPSAPPNAPARPEAAAPAMPGSALEAQRFVRRAQRTTNVARVGIDAARNRAAFAGDPQGREKVATLRRAGASLEDVTRLIDQGQLDAAYQQAAVAEHGGSVHAEAEEADAAPAPEPALPEGGLHGPDRAQPDRDAGVVSAGDRGAGPEAGRVPGGGPTAGVVEPPRAPAISAAPRPEPLATHGELPAVAAVIDPSRAPPTAAPARQYPEARAAAHGALQPYKGNKRKAWGAITEATRGTFGADADKVTTIHDPFGGGGGYGLSLALSEFPNAKKLVVGELSQGRLDKIRFIHESGVNLEQRAHDTGMIGAVEELWNQLYAERGQASGGGVQGRAADEVLESYFAPGGAGHEFAQREGLDLNEARGIVYALVDGMDRGVGSFDDIVRNAIGAAREGHEAAEEFRVRGGNIEYRQGDAFTQPYEGGPESVMALDPPYVGTTGYGSDRSNVGNHELYAKTADLLERARREGKSSIYTDEAWWAKADKHGTPALTPEEAKANDQILDRAQAATDRWAFTRVGNRTESVAVTNGFAPGEPREAVHGVASFRASEGRAAGDVEPTAGAAGEPARRAAGAAPSLRAPVDDAAAREAADERGTARSEAAATGVATPISDRLAETADRNLAKKYQALEVSRRAGRVTDLQARDRRAALRDAEVERLRRELPADEQKAHYAEQTTSEMAKDTPADPARRAAVKQMIRDGKWPGKVEDHPLGVKLTTPGGQSILLMDHDIPEESWNIKNWTASVLAQPEGTTRLKQAMVKALGSELKSTKEKSAIQRIHDLPRKKQLALMREIPPVAGVIEGAPRAHGIDADFAVHLGKTIDSVIGGGKPHAFNEEMRQITWRLMPEADRRAVLPELKRFGYSGDDIHSAGAEEAAQAWMERRPSLLKAKTDEPTSLLGRALRGVRSLLSKLIPAFKATPHIAKSDADRVYERVQGGDYLGQRNVRPSEAPMARRQASEPMSARFATRVPATDRVPLNDVRGLRMRQDAAERGELARPEAGDDEETRIGPAVRPVPETRMSTEADVRESVRAGAREKGELPVQGDAEVQDRAAALERSLGSVERQRAHAEDIASRAAAGEHVPDATEIAFLKRRAASEAAVLDRTHTPAALGRYLEAESQIVHGLVEPARALRQGRFDLNGEDGRRDYIRHAIFQLRGREGVLYNKAMKALARARERGQADAVARHRATIAALRAKAAERQMALRDQILRKYGVDLNDRNLGRVFSTRYSVGELLNTVAAHRKDYTVGDIIATSFRRGILSWPLTLSRLFIGNTMHYAVRTHVLPILKGLAGEVGLGDHTLGEYGHMLSASLPGLAHAFSNMKAAYLAGFDPKEHAAIGSKTGIGIGIGDHGAPGVDPVPSIIQSLTGLDDSYISSRMHSGLDAFFKAWAAHSMVAGEAYRVAKGEGRDGAAIGKRVQQILRDGPDTDESGAWERGYTQALPVTFQDSYNKEMTGPRLRNALDVVNKTAGFRVPIGFGQDVRPLLLAMPFTGTPFSILRHSASYLAPVQLAKMIVRGTSGEYAGEGRNKAVEDLAKLAVGSGLLAATGMLADKDDDQTWITGSDADYRSGEARLERRKATIQPYSIKLPGVGWVSYKNIEPFKLPVAAMVDWWRGKPTAQSAYANLHDEWLLKQAGDFVDMGKEWFAKGDTQHMRATRHFVAESVAGVTVPNLVRAGVKYGRDVSTGVATPVMTDQPRGGEGAAGLMGENVLQAMTGGAYHTAPPTIDLYGRTIPNGLASTSDIATGLLGAKATNPNPNPYDDMLIQWNKRVAQEHITTKDGKPADYVPSNWPMTFKDGKQSFLKTPEQVEQFNREAGAEFTRRLDQAVDNGALHPESPEQRDIDRFKSIKERVRAATESRLVKEWREATP